MTPPISFAPNGPRWDPQLWKMGRKFRLHAKPRIYTRTVLRHMANPLREISGD